MISHFLFLVVKNYIYSPSVSATLTYPHSRARVSPCTSRYYVEVVAIVWHTPRTLSSTSLTVLIWSSYEAYKNLAVLALRCLRPTRPPSAFSSTFSKKSSCPLSFTNIYSAPAKRLQHFRELLIITLVISDNMSASINASSLWGARPLHRIRSSLLLREVSIPRSRRFAYRRCLQMIRLKFVGMNDILRRRIAIRLTTYLIYSKSLAHVRHDDPKHAQVNAQELSEMSRICSRRLDMFMSLDLTAISQVMEKDSKEIVSIRNLYETEEEVREEFQDAFPALSHDWERFLYLQVISAMARSARGRGHVADQIMTELSPASCETDTQYQDSDNDLDMMDTTGDLEVRFDQMNLLTT